MTPQPREPGSGKRRAGLPALLLALVTGLGVITYYTQIQPGALIPVDPIEIVMPEEEGPHRIFVYGTLRSPFVRFVVTGRVRAQEPATLPGFRRIGRDITYDPDTAVEGYVIYVSTAELRRLDRYERTGQRYERVELILDDGEPAWVYRMLPSQ